MHLHEIVHKRYDHPAVYTVAEAEAACAHVPGIASKNIFLRTKKKDRYFLVVLPARKQLELKVLEQLLGVKKLSLASPEDLMTYLGLTPGSVSPFGLIHDTGARVEAIIDRDIVDADQVSFHPNVNTASLVLSHDMFARYLATLRHHVAVYDL